MIFFFEIVNIGPLGWGVVVNRARSVSEQDP